MGNGGEAIVVNSRSASCVLGGFKALWLIRLWLRLRLGLLLLRLRRIAGCVGGCSALATGDDHLHVVEGSLFGLRSVFWHTMIRGRDFYGGFGGSQGVLTLSANVVSRFMVTLAEGALLGD
jgi:hypothetical protein